LGRARACGRQVTGEKLVLEANGRGGLATVALRPSGIFGPGDQLFVPVTVEKAKQGKMKYIIGDGRNVMDFTYVGNVAQAHLQVGGPSFARGCLKFNGTGCWHWLTLSRETVAIFVTAT
jgi:nucleoside-diphosphate-sugar epimerase